MEDLGREVLDQLIATTAPRAPGRMASEIGDGSACSTRKRMAGAALDKAG